MKTRSLSQPIVSALDRLGERFFEGLLTAADRIGKSLVDAAERIAESRDSSAVVPERDAEPTNPPRGRDRRRRKALANMEVTDLDRAAADKAARKFGVVLGGRK